MRAGPFPTPRSICPTHARVPSAPLTRKQVQMRDLAGYIETRHTLFRLKPAARNNWVTWAVAHHIHGNHSMAVQILESYEKTLEEVREGGGVADKVWGCERGWVVRVPVLRSYEKKLKEVPWWAAEVWVCERDAGGCARWAPLSTPDWMYCLVLPTVWGVKHPTFHQ
eukprot:364389-Chlamydomonas_euryale.AAC.5